MVAGKKIINQLITNLNAEYPLFSLYVENIEKGLRKKALEHLNQFLKAMEDWTFQMKEAFCRKLFNTSVSAENDLQFILTSNLVERIIKPTLLQMIAETAGDYLPNLWYGQYFQETNYVKKAYELNPFETRIKNILLTRLENNLWLSTHHLPGYYIGNIENDERDLELAFAIIISGEQDEYTCFLKAFNQFRKLIEQYKIQTRDAAQ